MTGPSIENVERSSQATPLAEDFLKVLQGQLAEGAFGTGVGPLQREAGTAIRQTVSSLQGRSAVDTASQFGTEGDRLISGLETGSARRTARSSADLTELFGAAGAGRFGTAITQGQARLQGDANASLDELIGQILLGQQAGRQGARQFDVQANQAGDSQLIQAIAQLFNQGQGNIAPFQQLSLAGILPEEVIASPGIIDQLISGGLQAGSAFLGAPGAAGGAGGPSVLPGTPRPAGVTGATGAHNPDGTPIQIQF